MNDLNSLEVLIEEAERGLLMEAERLVLSRQQIFDAAQRSFPSLLEDARARLISAQRNYDDVAQRIRRPTDVDSSKEK